jgi:hypothetical protein
MTHRLLNIVDLKLGDMPHLELGHFVLGLAEVFAVLPGAVSCIPPSPKGCKLFGNCGTRVTISAILLHQRAALIRLCVEDD